MQQDSQQVTVTSRCSTKAQGCPGIFHRKDNRPDIRRTSPRSSCADFIRASTSLFGARSRGLPGQARPTRNQGRFPRYPAARFAEIAVLAIFQGDPVTIVCLLLYGRAVSILSASGGAAF